MKKEYKIPKGLAIFTYIACVLMSALSIALLVMPFIDEDMNINITYLTSPLALGLLTVMIIALIDTKNSRIILTETSLSIKSVLANRTLHSQEIAGYKKDQNYLVVYPKTRLLKKIKITLFYSNIHEIENWITTKVPDLEHQQQRIELKNVLKDSRLGTTKNERKKRLKQAKFASRAFNILGTLGFFGVVFLPLPVSIRLCIFTCLPLFGIGLMLYYRGLIRVMDEEKSSLPNINLGMTMAIFGPLLVVMFSVSIYDFSNMWLPVIALGVLCTLLVARATKELQFTSWKRGFSSLFISLFFMAYSYTFLCVLNCIFDTSRPKSYQAKVMDKWKSSGKTTSYNIKTSNWGPEGFDRIIDISKKYYEQVSVNDSIVLTLKQGFLHIPWFYVENDNR